MKRRWYRGIVLAVLTGGLVFQASCTEICADITMGLATSISNQYIGNVIDDYLGLGGGFDFGGFM